MFPRQNRLPALSPASEVGAAALGKLPQWDLSDLYPGMDSPEIKADLERARTECAAFEEAYKGRLEGLLDGADAGGEMAKALKRYEGVEELLGRLYSYAGLVYSGDTTDPVRAKFYGDVQEKLTEASTHLLFFTLEMNRLDDAKMEAALADPAFGYYRPWIDDVRADKPYQLEDRIEQLFHEKGVTSRGSWNRLFDETIAGLRFEVDGKSLPLEPTLNYLAETDQKKRKAGADALAKVFSENLRLFTLITNTLAKDKDISDRWRGFQDIADSRHLANRVEREVVDALVSSVHEAYPRLSHRYYKLKAKWFGKEKLEYWDRNAPLPKVETKAIAWTEARDTVLGAYSDFSPRMADIARDFFDKSWIDAGVRPGKATGAFAHPTVPSVHPYVLLNYMGKPRDVMTLAHELGHGVHQVLAGPNGALMAPTPLTLAETASVFGEMLTFRKLLDAAPDKAARKAMLSSKVEDMINTVVRQIAFYTFERRIHTERKSGELTAERICEIWMDVQATSLGEGIHLGPGYENYWVYIGHFIHSPFYVYAYAFGDCLVNSLYAVYENAAEGFAERYLAMLAAGGTKHHSELLKPFGLDARDPAFWQTGLNLIDRMIGELEAMEG
ncbi:M3 family oligoendopeptidase [Ancylobacter sonchi]|uniref:M3 family oligoendopeptidase n=1 Tax=Ancylobacter sonchi TaxID=1937790 RepID=UPI001BD2FAC4|nr:M3 family oligoendopeptidase [Ancylobacter sonchi]MBS7532712.1 M3 family oligoendopeptidase [Ancylobacter sonchi]